jgi:hypothetical protein
MALLPWQSTRENEPVEFRCGFCDREIGTREGYYAHNTSLRVYLCPRCGLPTFWDRDGNRQVPGSRFGAEVEHLPHDVGGLYKEARDAVQASADTAAVLACRKLLMHVAVEQGADEGRNFMEYVEYLADNNFVPPHGKGWVDHIRKRGNEANHEIVLMTRDDSTELIAFLEMLLKFIYEFPKRIPGVDATTEGV